MLPFSTCLIQQPELSLEPDNREKFYEQVHMRSLLSCKMHQSHKLLRARILPSITIEVVAIMVVHHDTIGMFRLVEKEDGKQT
jgi:hypothetical protein